MGKFTPELSVVVAVVLGVLLADILKARTPVGNLVR